MPTSNAGAAIPAEHLANSAHEISRRSMLQRIFLGLAAASVPSWVVEKAAAQVGPAELVLPFGPLGAQDYGPLVAQVVEDDLSSVNHQLFAPAGFNVRVVMRAGVNPVTLDATGTLGHVNPDGGAVYPQPDGGWIYVSNSEINPGGSVSALRFDASGELIDYYRICTATRQNCAGGQTPWGTWITCEEVTGGFAHECDPTGVVAQRQLTALGARNGREAVAIDPINNVCYQTLDSSTGKFVRFVSDPADLEAAPGGVTRMRMEVGVSQRLLILPFNGNPGYDNVTVPNTAAGSALMRQARPIQWVADSGTSGTNFNGGEGIWYLEMPAALRTIPAAGSVLTRGVMFFASKNDGRIWAVDIENSLIELIYDNHNAQAFTNLGGTGLPLNFNQVDNVYVSPGGDVLVAEDGTPMRLAIMFNNQAPKLLMQITVGTSEIAGPAFTPDMSRLYFSSQRGPSGTAGTGLSGTIYEMTIPPQFRALQRADQFAFEEAQGVPPAETVSSGSVVLTGFLGSLQVRITSASNGEFSVDDGASWGNVPVLVQAGAALRVRHLSSATPNAPTESVVTVGLPNGASETSAIFRSLTLAAALPVPLPWVAAAGISAGLLATGVALKPSDPSV